MGTVYLSRHAGAAGFARLVVVKRVHPHLLKSREFYDMFRDEARLASQIRHPNVVPVDDVVAGEGELFSVQPYIESITLADLLDGAAAQGERVPPAVASRVIGEMLAGLDGAHDATDLRGHALEIVHRDVSPQNVLVGRDGRSRLIDFGIAKAKRRVTHTSSGVLKGKLAYMAPEQLRRQEVDRRVDVFAAGVVLYEALVGARPFECETEGDTLLAILVAEPPPPSEVVDGLPKEIDAVVEEAIARDKGARYATAAEMAEALELAIPPAQPREVAAWVERVAGAVLDERRARVTAALDARVDTTERMAGASVAPRVAAPGPRREDTASALVVPVRRANPRWLVAAAIVAAIAFASVLALRARLSSSGAAAAASSAPSPEPAAASPPAVPPASSVAEPPPAIVSPVASEVALTPPATPTSTSSAAAAPPRRRAPASRSAPRATATATSGLHKSPYAP
jgi:serine/threonine-protein kinase